MRPSRTITAPTCRPMHSARSRVATAISMKYSSQSGRRRPRRRSGSRGSLLTAASIGPRRSYDGAVSEPNPERSPTTAWMRARSRRCARCGLRRARDHAAAKRLDAADEYPRGDRRRPARARRLRLHDPAGARRTGHAPARLLPRGRGDRARLDERRGHPQHALHRLLDAAALRHRRAARAPPPPARDRRAASRLLDDGAALRLRRAGDPHARRARGRRVGRDRREALAGQRPARRS